MGAGGGGPVVARFGIGFSLRACGLLGRGGGRVISSACDVMLVSGVAAAAGAIGLASTERGAVVVAEGGR